MLIDCHHHLWKYSAEQYGWISDEMSVLKQDFWTAELRQISNESAITGFVSVQARQSLSETDDLLRFAATEPLVRGVVGWVPLAADDVEKSLDRYADAKLLKGVRHVVQDEPDDRFPTRQRLQSRSLAAKRPRIGLRHFDLCSSIARRSRICQPTSRPSVRAGPCRETDDQEI